MEVLPNKDDLYVFSLLKSYVKIIAIVFNRAYHPHMEEIKLACSYISVWKGYINISFILALTNFYFYT